MSSEIASTPSLHPSRSVRGRAGGCTQRAVSEDRGDIHRVVSMIWSSTNEQLFAGTDVRDLLRAWNL